MTSIEQEFEKDRLPDSSEDTDSSEKELAIFGGELDALKGDILKNINKKQDIKDKNDAELILHTLDQTQNSDSKKSVSGENKNISFSVLKKIEESIGNDNPGANQGRVESYTTVSNFTHQVAAQGGIFGKLVNWLS